MIIQRTCWHEDVKGIFSQVYCFWFFGSCLLNYQISKCTKKATAYLGIWIELSMVGDKKTNLHNNQTICADIFMPRGALFMRTKAKENIPIPGIIPCFSI